MPRALPTDPADARALQRALVRLARAGQAPWLHAEVARRMAQRLSLMRVRPSVCIDWSGFLGASQAPLLAAYPGIERVVVEPAEALLAPSRRALRGPWWRLGRPTGRACLSGEVADESVQLVWANMYLHLATDRMATLAQWQRLLQPGGFVMFSTFGPDTLLELREIYAEQGWPEPQAGLVDMHDWGDAMLHCGFADPVLDQERLSLSWSSPEAALAELRQIGGNANPARFAGLRTPRWRRSLLDALLRRVDAQGRVAMNFEIVYGHAFKVAATEGTPGVTAVPLESLRAQLRRR